MTAQNIFLGILDMMFFTIMFRYVNIGGGFFFLQGSFSARFVTTVEKEM